jgi:H+/gluconate symporter-like permease
MSLAIVVLALALLMVVAYRGFSVVLFAPVSAMLAVLLTDPAIVAPVFSRVFMEKMVGFIKSYLPVFLLGAVFGKVIELSGFARSIVTAVISVVGRGNAMLSIVLVCALLTYGGVSLFVVVFAVYPFAAEDRARRVHLHHGCVARHAANPEHHPDQLLQDRQLGGAVAWRGRRALHAGDRPRLPRVAPAGGGPRR